MLHTVNLTCSLLLAASPEGQPGNSSEHLVTIFIAEIVLLLLLGRLFGELMQRAGQPAIMGQLIAGVILGPSVLGALWPAAFHTLFPDLPEQKRMLDAISQLGILMLLLLTGMETDLALVKRMGGTAFFTSISGILLPFTCGFLLGEFLPAAVLPDPGKRLVTSLFLATALSISSVKIVAMVIMEVDFMRRNIGQIILASAILDDTLGWIIIAVIGGLASQGTVKLSGLGLTVLGTLAFLAVSFTIGRRIIAYVIRWTNDHLLIELPVITAILIVTLIMSLITDRIGVHTVLGAFVAGILVGESPILSRHIEEQLRGLIVAMFAPVFFGVAGLSIDLRILKSPTFVGLALGLILIASFGKLIGCYAGGRLGGLNSRESTALAIGMNARGSTEVIVATIGLSIGALNTNLFTLIVVMALSTTLITPPLLRWALSRIPPTGEEKERLEREEAEAKDYLPNIERILIAVDDSRHGKLASALAGLFIGSRKILSTVLDVSRPKKKAQSSEVEKTAEAVKTAAEVALQNTQDRETGTETRAGEIVLTNETSTEDVASAVLNEVKKGYDMLFLGTRQGLDGDGSRDNGSAVEEILQEFQGAVAIVLAKRDREGAQARPKSILAPTTGTDYSRRAAEVAIAIAKASQCSVTALHVAPPPKTATFLLDKKGRTNTGRALVKDIQALGEREGVRVKPLIIYRRQVESAILQEIRRGDYDLIVMGTKARPGEQLFFGHAMSFLLEHSPCPMVIINS